MTDKWDPSIPAQKELAHQIEIGNGIPEMRPIAKAREALVKVGFEIQHEEDLADRPDPVAWYYPLEGDVFKAQTLWDVFTCWRTSTSGKFVSHYGLKMLEAFGMVPKGTWDVCETLKIAGDALVKSGQQKVRLLLDFSMSCSCWPIVIYSYVFGHQQEASRAVRSTVTISFPGCLHIPLWPVGFARILNYIPANVLESVDASSALLTMSGFSMQKFGASEYMIISLLYSSGPPPENVYICM